MKKLVKYLEKYKKECVLAPLLKSIEAMFELIVPLVIASMIDTSIPSGNVNSVIRNGFTLLGLAIAGIIVSVLAQFFAAKAAVGFAENLRHDLFSRIMGFSFTDIDSFSNSTIINRLTTDVNSVQTGINMLLRLFLRSPFIVAGATVMAAIINLKASLYFVAVIILLSVSVFFIVTRNIPLLKNIQNRMDALNTHIRANLKGARVIRAFVREENEKNVFSDRNNDVLNAQLFSGRISSLLNPITYVLINIFIVLLIRFGAIQVSFGTLTTGQVVALYNYMSQILIELVKFATLIITINKSFAGAIRINEIMDVLPNNISVSDNDNYREMINLDIDSDVAISLNDVSLRYHGEAEEALSDISFDIKKGEIVGIIGSTGSGKTSLANVIMGFYPVSKGSVYVDKTKKLSIVMQKAILFKGTVAENIKWGNESASDDDINSALDNACCLDTVNSLGGLDFEIHSGGSNLSGGQKQRLSIARALVGNPDILILDDSSSALDYLTDMRLRNNLRNLSNKPTVIIISQRIVSIKDADKIIVLDDGHIMGMGKHDDLIDNCNVYKEIYNSQV